LRDNIKNFSYYFGRDKIVPFAAKQIELMSIESERLDRIEQHLKLLKQDSEIRSADIKEIKQALLGNDLNGFRGLVWKISDIDTRVIDLEENDAELKVYVKQAKVIAVAFTAALVTLLFKAFSK
jgi:hypothetical protein